MKYRSLLFALAGIAACLAFQPISRAQAPASARDTQGSWTLHVLEGRRYSEAVQAANQLAQVAPSDAGAEEVRGAVALHVGDIGQAARDFHLAREHAGPGDPLAAYGVALCALFRKDYPEAAGALAQARKTVDDPDLPEIALAQAVLAAEEGDATSAQTASQVDSPAARELSALVAYHASPKDGVGLLDRFLAQSAVNGVPVVADPPGLRLTGAFDGAGSPLDPAVTDPTLRAMFAHRLDLGPNGGPVDPRHTLSGVVSLHPPASLDIPSRSAMVSVSADGRLIGVENASPYDFSWDTSSVPNGPHTLVWSVQVAGRMTNQTQPVAVLNKEAPAALSIPLPEPLRARLWKLLIVHPSYKVAEYLVAQAEERAGQTERANEHYLVVAAIDPSYRDVGARVAVLFAGHAPAAFPLPPGLKLAKTGSIAGENHADGFWIGNPRKYEIALTFDDGPNPGTPAMLDALESAHAPATFFVVGVPSSAAPDVVRRMAADGDEVEDHSYSHPNLDEALPNHIREEILRDAVIVRALAGRWPEFFRPPGGDANPQVLKVARECGMTGAFWTVDALSAEDTGSGANVTKLVVSHARPGAIILMHNGTPSTTAAIPSLVRELRARGYKLVTLRELAHDALD